MVMIQARSTSMEYSSVNFCLLDQDNNRCPALFEVYGL
jgi:hypothetical protein